MRGFHRISSMLVTIKHLLILLAVSSLVKPTISAAAFASSQQAHAKLGTRQKPEADVEKITRCLSSRRLTNFTVPISPHYNELLFSRMRNLVFNSSTFLRPSAIIIPHSASQLAAAIQCSSLASLTIRLRSGGHSFEGLSSTASSPFVIVDLRNLDRISIDPFSRTAWVESGATIGQLYRAIADSSPHLAFPAGSFPSIGTGGHFSGGGYGMLLRKYGLAADNILDAILIDADGRALDRAAMGEDVFWAIRGGGGGSFGAVYSWNILLLPAPETMTVASATRLASAARAAELVHKWQFVAPVLDDEYFLSMTVSSPGSANTTKSVSVKILAAYAGSKTMAVAKLTRLFPEMGLGEGDFNEMSWFEATEYETSEYFGGHAYFRIKEDIVREPISLEGLEGAVEWVQKKHAGDLVCICMGGGAMSRTSSDYTPYPHRANALFKLLYFVRWKEDENHLSQKYSDWVKGVYDYMGPFVNSNGQKQHPKRVAEVNELDLDFGVMDWERVNECDWWKVGKKWGEVYFMGNYERLVRAKSLIDPKNVFRHPQSIPPLPKHCGISPSLPTATLHRSFSKTRLISAA